MRHSLRHKLHALAVVFCFLSSAFPLFAQNAPDRPTTHVFRLQHVSAEFALFSNKIETLPTTQPLAKEPVYRSQQVIRGFLLPSPDPNFRIPFVWDKDGQKLYLDLNRNGDLTDDPVFENKGQKDAAKSSQVFKTIPIPSSRGPQYGLWGIDLTLNVSGPSGFYATVSVSSGWESEIELHGKKVLLAVLRDFETSPIYSNALVLRESGKPYHEMYKIAPPPRKLFFDGHLYALSFDFEPAEAGGVMVARLAERTVPLGECEVAGKHVARLVLTEPKVTARDHAIITESNEVVAIVDQPRGRIPIPLGQYSEQQVFLDAGTSVGVFSATCRTKVAATTTGPLVLRLGAPLRNSVEANWYGKGGPLRLEHRLTGIGGEVYSLPSRDPARAPRFAIYENEKKLASGSFEYG